MRDLRTALSRLRRLVLAGAALALLGSLLTATPAQAASPYTDLKIQNLNSLLCLAPAGGSSADNATIVQYLCQTQPFRTFIATWSTTQRAYAIENTDSFKCLSPAGGATGLNVVIVQFRCDSDPSRYWHIAKASGVWTLQNVKSGLCLSPAGGGTGLNTAMVQYTCDGSPARNWDLLHAMGIQNENSGQYCATVAGGSTTPNTAAVTYNCDMYQNPARLWEEVVTTTPNSVMLRNVGTGLCLSPAGGATAVNTVVVEYYCDGQTPRLWTLNDDGQGFTHIVSNVSGLCLAPADGSTGLNVALVTYWCDADPSRSWLVVSF